MYMAAADPDRAIVRDVTVGDNGYPATPGFDLATGWGSPRAPAFVDALAATSPGCRPAWRCAVPANRGPRGCLAEWLLPAGPVDTRTGGWPRRMQSCRDGDPSCDEDGLADGRCMIQAALCLNLADPRLHCSTRTVSRVRLRSPSSRGPAALNRERLEAALTRLPALPTDLRSTCSAPVSIEVPLRRGTRPGRRVLRAAVRSGRRSIRAMVKLRCLPSK